MSVFHFKEFSIEQSGAAMKVGTDAMLLGSLIEPGKFKYGLDIGAGTGVLSLMVAQENPEIQIHAVEKDKSSYECCLTNFGHSPWWNRLSAFQDDFLRYKSDVKYDLIFTNPPYYQTNNENNDSRMASAKHSRSLPPEHLLSYAHELLDEEGEIWLIVPYVDQKEWENLFSKFNLYTKHHIKIQGKEGSDLVRSVYRLVKKPCELTSKHLTVRSRDDSYTVDYIELTRSFHGKALR